MNKGILLAVYVVIAAAIIGVGAWYVSSMNTAPASVAVNNTNNNNVPNASIGGGTINNNHGWTDHKRHDSRNGDGRRGGRYGDGELHGHAG